MLSHLDVETFKQRTGDEYRVLFLLYILAEKLHDVSAKNSAIIAAINVTKMKSESRDWAAPSLVTYNSVCEGTPRGSLARSLVMDMCGTLPLSYIFLQLRDKKFHPKLVSDLVKMIEKMRQFKSGFVGNVITKNGTHAYVEEVKERSSSQYTVVYGTKG